MRRASCVRADDLLRLHNRRTTPAKPTESEEMSALELLAQMRDTEVTDSENVASIAAAVKRMPQAADDLLRFFDRGATYMLYGKDAPLVASEYFKSASAVRYTGSGDDKQPYLHFNKTMGAEIIRTALMQQRRRIEVYASSGSGSSWSLERRGSPGNLQAFEEECLRDTDLSADTSPVIVGVRLVRKTSGASNAAGGSGAILVGCAFVDCSVRSIRVSEFEDDEHLSTLESLLCQQGAKECLLPVELGETTDLRSKLTEVLELCEVPTTTAKKGTFATKEAELELRKLLGVSELHNRAFASPDQLAISAASGLIKYLDLMAVKETHGLWAMDWIDAAQYMRLDAGAMRALSVEPQPGDHDKNASLLGLFSVCKTAMGSRLVRKWLKQPLLDRSQLEERYDLVEALIRGYETRSMLRDEVLPKLGADLDKLGRKFAAKKATLKEVVHLYYFVLNLPRLLQALRQHSDQAEEAEEAELIAAKFTKPLEEVYSNFTNLVRLVQASIDLAAAQRHEFLLQPHFSPELSSLSDDKESVKEKIEGHHEKLQSQLGRGIEVHLELDSKFGYCCRVTRTQEALMRSAPCVKSGKLRPEILQTRKDGILFRDTEMASYAEEYSSLNSQWTKAQRDLAGKVVDTAATFGPVSADCHALLAELDVVLAFAHVSASAPEPYVRPKLVAPEDPRQRIVLRGCRHPCVERVLDGAGFIKNDVELIRGEASLQVVTGPNMGGKSTYIRAAGVSVLMAQVGCFVPCDEAEISIADAILARVGAGDCQSRGVSTFMAEMLETATILKGATASSLVIIDELGRGTSTYDGFGLAWAIAHHLVTNVGCCTLFATHFHELCALSQQQTGVVNRHVSAHLEDSSMTMLYKVEDGPCDKAFGIHVAEVAEFPASVVRAAKRKLAELEATNADGDADDAAEGGKGAPPGTGGVASRSRSVLGATDEHSAAALEVRSFLDAFRALPMAEMAEEERAAAVVKLAEQRLKGSAHPMVRALCSH